MDVPRIEPVNEHDEWMPLTLGERIRWTLTLIVIAIICVLCAIGGVRWTIDAIRWVF